MFKEYYHLPEKSKGNAKEDVIFIPNIPMFASGSSMKDAGYFTLMGFKVMSVGLWSFKLLLLRSFKILAAYNSVLWVFRINGQQFTSTGNHMTPSYATMNSNNSTCTTVVHSIPKVQIPTCRLILQLIAKTYLKTDAC